MNRLKRVLLWIAGFGTPVLVLGLVAGGKVAAQQSAAPARIRFQANDACVMGTNPSCLITFDVPAGKLLVVETLSLEAFVQPGERPVENIYVSQNGTQAGYYNSVPLASNFGYDVYAGTIATKLYADPGTSVYVNIVRNGTLVPSSVGTGAATISGYLVDCGDGATCPLP